MSNETTVVGFPCPECDKVFPTSPALQGHYAQHFKKKPERVACPDCGGMYLSGTGMSQHRQAKHGPGRKKRKVVIETVEAPVKKRGRPPGSTAKPKPTVDLDWTTDDIFQTVITALWPGGNIPAEAVLPLIQWRETTREFLEKVRS